MASAYAPYNATMGNFAPYLTTTEYLNAPTSIDTGNLIPNGAASVQLTALAEVIGRASSWIDGFVTGSAYGTLNSTSNVENARVWGSYRNTLIVHPRYWPITEVQTFQYSSLAGGVTSNNAASITPSANITVYPDYFEVALAGVIALGLNAPSGIMRGYEYDCQWTYVNGFPNTTLSASVAAGAASVNVVSGIGIYPGSLLTLFDAPNDEGVAVASNYVPGGTVIPLTANLAYNHAVGSTLTNLPKSVKQAAILLTSALIKQRGSGALEVADMGVITKMSGEFPQGEDSDIGLAVDLLRPLQQKYMGY